MEKYNKMLEFLETYKNKSNRLIDKELRIFQRLAYSSVYTVLCKPQNRDLIIRNLL